MQDDKLQGILFNQSDIVDLIERKPSEKLARTMLAKKHALQRWSERQHLMLRQALRSDEDASYAVRGKKHYAGDIAALQSRLKPRD